MKRKLWILAVSGMILGIQSLNSCEYVHEEWHRPFAAHADHEHHSPTPEHNVMVPEEEHSHARQVEDKFSQEDQSTVDGGGIDRVQTNQSLEEHLVDLYTEDSSKNKTYTTRSSFSQRKLTKDDVVGPGMDAHAFYSIKDTSGMVYKTDQTRCDTPFEHPVTNFEKTGDPDHTIAQTPDGDIEYTSDDNYCFFLLIPGNGNLEGKVARVDVGDNQSKSFVREGIAPYMRLKDEEVDKLQSGASDLYFVKGRYIARMPEGNILLPTNGTNMVFNRTTVYRPYFQDVKRRTTGAPTSQATLSKLDNTFPPVKVSAGEEKPNYFQINGLGVRMNGLNHKSSIITRPGSDRIGSKLSGWGGARQGDPYLALGPANSATKQLNYAMHFPSAEAEEEYMEKVSSGELDANANRDNTAVGGIKPANSSQIDRYLSDEIQFQLNTKGSYPDADGSDVEFDPNAITDDDNEVSCSEANIKPWCDKYKPFHDALAQFYAEQGVAVPGAENVWRNRLNTEPLTTVQNIYGKDWYITATRKAISDFMAAHTSYIQDLEVRVPGSDAQRQEYNWVLFMTREPTLGKPMDHMLTKMKIAWKSDAQRLAENNLMGEDANFTSTMQTVWDISNPDTCEGALRNRINQHYIGWEHDVTIGHAWMYYTSVIDEGMTLLTRLGMVQRTIDYPSSAQYVWKAYMPDSYLTECVPGDVLSCQDYIKGDEDPTLRPLGDFKERFDPDANPLLVEYTP